MGFYAPFVFGAHTRMNLSHHYEETNAGMPSSDVGIKKDQFY